MLENNVSSERIEMKNEFSIHKNLYPKGFEFVIVINLCVAIREI